MNTIQYFNDLSNTSNLRVAKLFCEIKPAMQIHFFFFFYNRIFYKTNHSASGENGAGEIWVKFPL